MRLAAIALLTVCVGCQEERTGIVLTVFPADDPVVKGADRLEIHIGMGRDGMIVDRPTGDTVLVHLDDGQAVALTRPLGHAFTGPEVIELSSTGDATTEPFWVSIRAVDDNGVHGEGGYPGALQIVHGQVFEGEVTINGIVRREYVANCAGVSDAGGVWHYLADAIEAHDCDADHHFSNVDDCDDFDIDTYPLAPDGVCDGVNHTCETAGMAGTVACVGSGDPQACFLGTSTCIDGDPGNIGTCMVDFELGLPAEVCMACAGKRHEELAACLKTFASRIYQCDVDRAADRFCPTLFSPQAFGIGPDTWWQNAGVGGNRPGAAFWLELPRPREFDFGFVLQQTNPTSMAFSSSASDVFPPSPAIRWTMSPSQPPDSHVQSEQVGMVRDGIGPVELWFVHFDIRDDGCDPNETVADCTQVGP